MTTADERRNLQVEIAQLQSSRTRLCARIRAILISHGSMLDKSKKNKIGFRTEPKYIGTIYQIQVPREYSLRLKRIMTIVNIDISRTSNGKNIGSSKYKRDASRNREVFSSPTHSLHTDLHMHSTASDGRLSPQDVLESALVGGLDVIALTDHMFIHNYLLDYTILNKQEKNISFKTEYSLVMVPRFLYLMKIQSNICWFISRMRLQVCFMNTARSCVRVEPNDMMRS